MQIIDLNKPYFVDPLPAPNTVAKKEKFAFTNFQNTKQYFSVQFFNNVGISPLTYSLFTYEDYNLNPTLYDNNISVNGNGLNSYSYLLNQIQNNAFKIWWIKISWRFSSFTADPQITQPLIYNCKDANGNISQDQVLGYEDLDPYQKTFNVINVDLRNDEIILDQDRFLTYSIIQDPGVQGATFNLYYEKSLQSDVLDEQKEISNLLTEF